MNARLPLALAIVVVLASGAAVAVIRPGDLGGGDDAAHTPRPSTTSPAPGAGPGRDPVTPPTTTTSVAPTTTSPPAAPTPESPGSGTAPPGATIPDEAPDSPRLVRTGGTGDLVPAALTLVLSAATSRCRRRLRRSSPASSSQLSE